MTSWRSAPAPGANFYVVRTRQRDGLQHYLNVTRIDTLNHYPVSPHLPQVYAYGRLRADIYPLAEDLAVTCLSLPMWPGMTEDQVVDSICGYFERP